MPYVIVIGLVILLVILLVARSAQQEIRSDTRQPSAEAAPVPTAPSPAPSPPPVRDAAPPFGGQDVRHRLAVGYDSYLWESRRIAHRHESRAATLDSFGVLASILAGLVALGSVIGFLSAGDELEQDSKVFAALSACVSILGLIAVAAVFFGFGAVVRNTSRSLVISAAVALDNYHPPDETSHTDGPARVAVVTPAQSHDPWVPPAGGQR